MVLPNSSSFYVSVMVFDALLLEIDPLLASLSPRICPPMPRSLMESISLMEGLDFYESFL